MSSEKSYDNIPMHCFVSDVPEERAKLIKETPTGYHVGETTNGDMCIVCIVQGESMSVKIQRGIRVEITHYNSNGEVVSHNK